MPLDWLARWRRRGPVAAPGGRGRFSAAKLSLSVIAGLLIALAVVQRPLTAPLPGTLALADMTWLEVRSALDHGYTTVIVPSGGIEQNGPHMILGKHDHIVGYTARRIAETLGHALVAPVISLVPEGDYDPPTGNMRFPGTIGVPERVFADMLEGVARSLRAAGFKTICFIADHGQSQPPQAAVAKRLGGEWAAAGIRVISVGDYYAVEAQNLFLTQRGESLAAIGQHAGIVDTSELMAVHPRGVDLERFAALPFSLEPTGADGDPLKASAERGKAMLEIKVDAAVRQIRAASGS